VNWRPSSPIHRLTAPRGRSLRVVTLDARRRVERRRHLHRRTRGTAPRVASLESDRPRSTKNVAQRLQARRSDRKSASSVGCPRRRLLIGRMCEEPWTGRAQRPNGRSLPRSQFGAPEKCALAILPPPRRWALMSEDSPTRSHNQLNCAVGGPPTLRPVAIPRSAHFSGIVMSARLKGSPKRAAVRPASSPPSHARHGVSRREPGSQTVQGPEKRRAAWQARRSDRKSASSVGLPEASLVDRSDARQTGTGRARRPNGSSLPRSQFGAPEKCALARYPAAAATMGPDVRRTARHEVVTSWIAAPAVRRRSGPSRSLAPRIFRGSYVGAPQRLAEASGRSSRVSAGRLAQRQNRRRSDGFSV